MAIIADAMQQQGQAEQPMEPQEQPAAPTQGMTPEKAQEIHQRLGQAAMKVIYTKPESERLMEIMQGGADDPANAVAQAAMSVLGRLQVEVKGIDPRLVYSIAPAVVVLLLEMGITAQAFEPTGQPPEMIGDVLAVLAEMTKEQVGQTQGQQMPPEQPIDQMPQPMTGA